MADNSGCVRTLRVMELWTSHLGHLLVERNGYPIGMATQADVMNVLDLHKEAEIVSSLHAIRILSVVESLP